MKWNEVRNLYPSQWVKLCIIDSHKKDNYLYIDDVEIIKPIMTEKEAIIELTKNKGNRIVFHTSYDLIRSKLITNLGLCLPMKNCG